MLFSIDQYLTTLDDLKTEEGREEVREWTHHYFTDEHVSALELLQPGEKTIIAGCRVERIKGNAAIVKSVQN